MSVRVTAVVLAVVMVRMMVMMATSITMVVVMVVVIMVTASSLMLMRIFLPVLMLMLMGAGIQRTVSGEKVESSQDQKSDSSKENIDMEGWIEVFRNPSTEVEVEEKGAPY